VPRIGQKRKIEPGWEDVTLDQRKIRMESNPPPFDYRWDDATMDAVNVALATYNGSHMFVSSLSLPKLFVPAFAAAYRSPVLPPAHR
jgi:hypothetical protein